MRKVCPCRWHALIPQCAERSLTLPPTSVSGVQMRISTKGRYLGHSIPCYLKMSLWWLANVTDWLSCTNTNRLLYLRVVYLYIICTAFRFHQFKLLRSVRIAFWSNQKLTNELLIKWGTGIRGLIRGMANLLQANQELELLVVRDKVGRPQVSLG